MRILAIDTETTGLSFDEDRITELGWCLYDTETNTPLIIQNDLIRDHGMQISPAITELTGITDDMCNLYGVSIHTALFAFKHYSGYADAYLAHNAAFDRGMLQAAAQREGIILTDLPWICSDRDIPYPKSIFTRKLTHLAAEHGFINANAHRAIFDVMTMLKIVSHYNWAEIIETSKSPLIQLEAVVKKPWQDGAEDGAKDVDRAKGLGFRFDFATKKWVKAVRACHADAFREQLREANLKAMVVQDDSGISR